MHKAALYNSTGAPGAPGLPPLFLARPHAASTVAE